jgi:hypothetical protein
MAVRKKEVGMAKKDNFKHRWEKAWPEAKKELEKALKNARIALNKSEVYLKNVTEKGAEQTKKISLGLKKEKLYYDLGKEVAATSVTKWKSSRKISALLKEIKKIDKQILK